MRPGTAGRRAVARVWAAGFLVAFLATGPGTAGVEVAFHLAGGGTADHARGVHYEQAGTGAHSDHCQLGLTAGGRLPASPGERLRQGAATVDQPLPAIPAPRTALAPSLPHSRAPPALA